MVQFGLDQVHHSSELDSGISLNKVLLKMEGKLKLRKAIFLWLASWN
jgi:hypothetical protein